MVASVAGRPYNVGFTLRVISAPPEDSALTQHVLNVVEYSYDAASFALVARRQLLASVPYELARGSFLEFTAGRDTDRFTVVFVNCSSRCEVRHAAGLYYRHGSLGSRAVSVLDSGAVGPEFKSQSRRCRVTVLGKLFTPIVPLFTKQRNLPLPSPFPSPPLLPLRSRPP